MISKILVASALCAGIAMGQTAAPSPAPSSATAQAKPLAFDVVSIRPDPSPPGRGLPQFGPTPDGYSMINMQLILPIITAYIPQSAGISSFTQDQIVGLPNWAKNDRYDVDAKVSEEDLPQWQEATEQPAMLRAMMQQLLEVRCKMAVHREVKEVPVYSLVLAKGGPKFKPTDPGQPHPGGINLPWGGTVVPAEDGIHLYATTMKSFATFLSQMVNGRLMGRTIQENTGLTGTYDILIQAPQIAQQQQTGAQPATASPPDPVDAIFTAVAPLGLKVESTKAPVETLVIDHIEKPSEN